MNGSEYNYTDYTKADDLAYKTIESCSVVPAEYGRTYSHYICIVFTDGTRALIGGVFPAFKPRPLIESMRAAPLFFSILDIVERVEETVRMETPENRLKLLDELIPKHKETGYVTEDVGGDQPRGTGTGALGKPKQGRLG